MTSADPAAARAAADPLTEEQQQHLLTAVAAMLRGAVTGQPAVFPPELTELRDRPVGGAFVSVKRELLDKAVAALNGATFSGKVAQAQPARARSTGTSSPNDG